MTEVPKIVYDRLRATQKNRVLPDAALPDSEHPDANLLTAFAERTLSADERDATLEHLALCKDCREVIALTLPVTEIANAPIAAETEVDLATPALAKTEKSWLTLSNWPKSNWPKLAWPNLRWAALAAGVVVVASLLLMHPGRLNQAMLPSANQQVATPVPPVSGAQIASSSVPPSPTILPMQPFAIPPKTDEAQLNPKTHLAKKSSPPTPEAGRRITSHQPVPSSEAPEVAATGAPVTAEPPAEATLMAQAEAPAIEKAKPPLQDTEAPAIEANDQQKPKTALAPRLPAANAMSVAKLAGNSSRPLAQHGVAWTISDGVLRRSLDSGQSWQDALHPNHPLLCYATHGDDIWTAGQAGTLFHSADGGLTWVQVQPSTKGKQLSSDVTNIELRGTALQGDSLRDNAPRPVQVVLSTSNNDIWISADGGTTWQKQ
jgi:hypothetical protein